MKGILGPLVIGQAAYDAEQVDGPVGGPRSILGPAALGETDDVGNPVGSSAPPAPVTEPESAETESAESLAARATELRALPYNALQKAVKSLGLVAEARTEPALAVALAAAGVTPAQVRAIAEQGDA